MDNKKKTDVNLLNVLWSRDKWSKKANYMQLTE